MNVFPARDPPGTGLRGSRPDEADSMDMFRGVHCLLHLGLAVRATAANMAGEEDEQEGTFADPEGGRFTKTATTIVE